jgi:hypothetical protein
MQVVLGSQIVVCAGSAAFASACGLQDYFFQLRSFDLRNRILENRLAIKRIYCELALALLEGTDDGPFVCGRSNAVHRQISPCRADLPMSVLSLIFVQSTVQECLTTPAVCDLTGMQTSIFLLSMVSSCGMFMYKIGMTEALTLRYKEKDWLLVEQRRLFAENSSSPESVQVQAGASAAPAATPPGNQLAPPAQQQQQQQQQQHQLVAAAPPPAPDFITHRNVTASPSVVIANVQPVASSSRSVRGVCDGCLRNVWSDDEVRVLPCRAMCRCISAALGCGVQGRVREGERYYHEECVKGYCGGCGLVVHCNDLRQRLDGVYWHADCVS